MRTIGVKTVGMITNSINLLLTETIDDLDKAYLKSEGPLAITISVKLKPDENLTGSVEIDTSVSFVLEKVKATMANTVNENQLELFDAIKDGRVTVEAKG
jgi:hypothetical protein